MPIWNVFQIFSQEDATEKSTLLPPTIPHKANVSDFNCESITFSIVLSAQFQKLVLSVFLIGSSGDYLTSALSLSTDFRSNSS